MVSFGVASPTASITKGRHLHLHSPIAGILYQISHPQRAPSATLSTTILRFLITFSEASVPSALHKSPSASLLQVHSHFEIVRKLPFRPRESRRNANGCFNCRSLPSGAFVYREISTSSQSRDLVLGHFPKPIYASPCRCMVQLLQVELHRSNAQRSCCGRRMCCLSV